MKESVREKEGRGVKSTSLYLACCDSDLLTLPPGICRLTSSLEHPGERRSRVARRQTRAQYSAARAAANGRVGGPRWSVLSPAGRGRSFQSSRDCWLTRNCVYH